MSDAAADVSGVTPESGTALQHRKGTLSVAEEIHQLLVARGLTIIEPN